MRKRRAEERQTQGKVSRTEEKVLDQVQDGSRGDEETKKGGILDSVQEMVWGKKK